MMTIEQTQIECFVTAVRHGWWPMVKYRPDQDEPMIDSGTVDLSQVNIPEKLMLIVAELGEALEHYREGERGMTEPVYHIAELGEWRTQRELENGPVVEIEIASTKPDGFAVELADCIIRIFDLAGALGINMEAVLRTKMEYNRTRPYRHGNKKC